MHDPNTGEVLPDVEEKTATSRIRSTAPHQICGKERFLELIHDFIVFEPE